MLDFLGPEMPWTRRVALANRWLTGGTDSRQFASQAVAELPDPNDHGGDSHPGGEKENVLPRQAEALVNVRLLPGDTSESALRRIKTEVRRLGFDEKSFTCSLKTAQSEPSRISSIDSDGFRTLQRTIAEVYPGVVVTPASRWSRPIRGITPRSRRTSTASSLFASRTTT